MIGIQVSINVLPWGVHKEGNCDGDGLLPREQCDAAVTGRPGTVPLITELAHELEKFIFLVATRAIATAVGHFGKNVNSSSG